MINLVGTMPAVVATVVGAFAVLYAYHYRKHIACRRYCKSLANLTGKTVIITGGNSGIGKVTALDLARRGARVILACRSLQKAEEAAKEIKTRTGNSEVVVRHLDLSSLQSVREFAKRINESEERLDILINNAGVVNAKGRAVSEDNLNTVFATNHFGHFLLTNLLLDLLKKSAPSRVVTVSSTMHTAVSRPLDLTRDGGTEGGVARSSPVLYPHLRKYIRSKLANILFSSELAKRTDSTGVASVALHPGVVYTPIWRRSMKTTVAYTLLFYLVAPLFWLFFIDEEAGAQTTLHCALDDSVPRLSGRYFANCAETKPSALAMDDAAASRLWQVSCDATGVAWSERGQ